MSYICADELRRDNLAILRKKKEIEVKGWGSLTTDENWDILAEVIRTTTSLEWLGFDKSTVIALQNDKVVDALAKNRTIKSLDLENVCGGDEGAKAVAAILKENSMIEAVGLYQNKISGEGAKAIAEAIKVNKTLQHIYLNSNRIGDEGAKAIAEALKENITLQMIHLYGNSIGDKGAYALVEALKENVSLRELYIGGNNIGDEGAKALVEALKKNTSLQTLFILNNNIGEEGGKYILNALQQIQRSAIESIYLRGNQISTRTMEKIDQEMARIQKRFESVGSNEGQVAANATAAGGSQGVQNERPSSKEDEGVPTIHATNASQGSAENVQETNNEAGNTTTAMETEVEHLKSTIAQLQGKIAEQDKQIASMKDIMKTIGNLANGKDGGTTSNTESSIPDRETELQSEIERYKQEVDSLKEKLKNSRPITETVDLTNEIEPSSSSEDESGGEEASPKRQRTENGTKKDSKQYNTGSSETGKHQGRSSQMP